MLTNKPRPNSVSMLTPLEMPVGRDVLIAVLEDVLTNIYANRDPESETEEDAEEIDLLIAQREQFLTWLRVQSSPNVAVALYPVGAAEDITHLLVSPPQRASGLVS
jgi:hypothetical protein